MLCVHVQSKIKEKQQTIDLSSIFSETRIKWVDFLQRIIRYIVCLFVPTGGSSRYHSRAQLLLLLLPLLLLLELLLKLK